MATLWIREYSEVARVSGVPSLPVPQEPGVDQTPLTFSTSAQSAAFAAETRFIDISGSAAFHYVVAANPTATVNAKRVPADTIISVGVPSGHKIAAILAV